MSERKLDAARAKASQPEDDVLERDAAADVRAFYLQAAFRALLDAMARPGELAELPEAPARVAAEATRMGVSAAALELVDVLLDAATSFAVAGPDAETLSRAVAGRTHALVKPVADAAFVLVGTGVRGEEAADAVRAASAGTLVAPHLGATVLVECGSLVGLDEHGARTGFASGLGELEEFELSGPGVNGSSRLTLDRGDVMRARVARGDEFPCGIDLVFVDGAGHVACVPRSSAVVVPGAGATPAAVTDDAAGTSNEGGASWAM